MTIQSDMNSHFNVVKRFYGQTVLETNLKTVSYILNNI